MASANPSTTAAIRVGILGASKSAQSVWRPLHVAGLVVVAVGGHDLKDAESFIKACNEDSIGQEDALFGTEKQQQQQQQEHQQGQKSVEEELTGMEVRACTYNDLVSIREVDVVYVTVPVEVRDHWVITCIHHRKHVLLSPPAAPSAAILQKWMALASPLRLLLTDDAALMHSRRMERVWNMFRGTGGEASLGALRDIRVSCSVGRSKNSRAFSATCIGEDSHIGVLGDLGWLVVATVLNPMQGMMPTAVLGHALWPRGAKGGSITEFSGELIFADAGANVTASIHLSRAAEAEAAAAEQSLTVHGTSGSAVVHDLIVPVPDADGNHVITVVTHEAEQKGNLRRNLRCEKELHVQEVIPWAVCPWRCLRVVLEPNLMYRGGLGIASRFCGDTEEGIACMKRSWRTQAVIDALVDASRMSDEEKVEATEGGQRG